MSLGHSTASTATRRPYVVPGGSVDWHCPTTLAAASRRPYARHRTHRQKGVRMSACSRAHYDAHFGRSGRRGRIERPELCALTDDHRGLPSRPSQAGMRGGARGCGMLGYVVPGRGSGSSFSTDSVRAWTARSRLGRSSSTVACKMAWAVSVTGQWPWVRPNAARIVGSRRSHRRARWAEPSSGRPRAARRRGWLPPGRSR
jgi:hypothetical protein